MDLTTGLKRVIATGKLEYGTKKTVDSIRSGKAKAVIIAENTPSEIMNDINNYAKIAEIPVVTYDGTSLSLGEICGKPFVITAIAVTNAGDVKIKELTGEKQ